MIVFRTPGGFSLRLRPRSLAAGTAGALLALGVSVLAIGGGDYPMSPGDVLRTLAGHGSAAQAFVVGELRLPRAVTALAAGAALALAGTIFQSLSRNPLGSPDILGLTQGASTGALVVVVVGGGGLVLSGAAVAGGLAAGLAVYVLAWRNGAHGHRLVLAGIGLAAILTGVNGYLLTRAQLMDAARAMLWLTGSLDGRGWEDALPLLAAMVVVVPVVLGYGGTALRMAELGDETATALGVRVDRVRPALLGAAAVLVSFAAAATGPVSFVALVAPHLAKRMTGAPGPNPVVSMGTGAALMACADWAGQRAPAGHPLPVGVVTGGLGGAYLVWLLATGAGKAGRA